MFDGVLQELIASGITFSLQALTRVKFISCRLRQPSAEIRVSFSALLRITYGDRYLLVRNLHRNETFGPFGGVHKYLDEAQPVLDSLDFRPQVIDADMLNDLRGFLPRKNLPKLYRWYTKKDGRESPTECLCRELKEELEEIDLTSRVNCPDGLRFRLVRSVTEGPEAVPGQTYTQFRVFEVYDIFPVNRKEKAFLKKLRQIGKRHKDLCMADAKQIVSGRASRQAIIGHHAGYLLGRRRVRPETPIFSSEATQRPTRYKQKRGAAPNHPPAADA